MFPDKTLQIYFQPHSQRFLHQMQGLQIHLADITTQTDLILLLQRISPENQIQRSIGIFTNHSPP